jgi:hypothetical protein
MPLVVHLIHLIHAYNKRLKPDMNSFPAALRSPNFSGTKDGRSALVGGDRWKRFRKPDSKIIWPGFYFGG